MDYFISIQLKRLKSQRIDERIMGCDQLAAASNLPPLAINLLEEAALLDSDSQVRQAANQALQAHGYPGVSDAFVPTPFSTDNQTGSVFPMASTRAIKPTDTPGDESHSEKLKRILPSLLILAFVTGFALFDWLFPVSRVQEALEREYPDSIRWMVFFSSSGDSQKYRGEWSGERGYLLIPESFLQAQVLIVSTHDSPSYSSVDLSWNRLEFLVVIGGYGCAITTIFRRRSTKG